MKQLDQKATWLFFLGFVARLIIPFIILGVYVTLFFTVEDPPKIIGGETAFGFLKWLWLIIPLFLIFCFVWAKLTNHFYRYELTEAGFRKESGIIYKEYITIPYNRIQNVDIYRGILARILGLSDLNIQTAGSSALFSRYRMSGVLSEGQLPGLSKEAAETLRDELIQRARESKNQGL